MNTLPMIMLTTAIGAVTPTVSHTNHDEPQPKQETELLILEPRVILPLSDDLTLVVSQNNAWFVQGGIMECVNAARQACGESDICWLRVRGDPGGSCEFACRDGNGNCPPVTASRAESPDQTASMRAHQIHAD